MNRRQLLTGALASAAVLAAPKLAFAGVQPKVRRALLGQAWERAARTDRPLLVLLIPDSGERARGLRMGIWLNNAPDPDLAPLGRLELACATLPELDRLVPGVRAAKGAWMVLVRVDQDTPTWRSVVVTQVREAARLPPYEDFTHAYTQEHGNSDWDTINRAWRARREQVSQLRLDAELDAFRASIGRVLASEGLDGGATGPLAETARERWVAQAPPGAHWGRAGGCGGSVEPNPGEDYLDINPPKGFMCGIGHVDAYAARFLHFWPVG